MVFDGGLGERINKAISQNNGLFQQLQGIGERETPRLPEYLEGEFIELQQPKQRALPSPSTERQKRLKRYKRKRKS